MVKKRLAIVNDMPGVTRDRIYHKVELDEGIEILLTDTGGLEPTTNDYILAEMKTQTVKALQEADLVMMMVDGNEGLTAMDEEVADLIRKNAKQVLLLVNKIDIKGAVHNVSDFYSLGFEDMIPVSSAHGDGLSSVKEAIIDKLNLRNNKEPNKKKSDKEQVYNISIIGKPNVGKSSLLNRIIGEDRVLVSDLAGTTRDAIDVSFKRKGKTYKIIDTAGIRRKAKVKDFVEKISVLQAQKNIEKSDVVLMLVDSGDDPSLQDANIVGYAHNHYKNVIILFNKWDLVQKDTHTVKKVEATLRQKMKFLKYAPILFISAKTGQRVTKIFDLIENLIEQSTKKITTSKLNDFLAAVKKRHKAPTSKMGKHFKMYYITQTGTLPVSFKIFTNTKYQPHFSYARYIENELRKEFGFKNIPLKIEFIKKPNKFE
jgi:GTP-binding protein